MSENSGIKVTKQRGFTIVYNDMLPEGEISARAWGIYVYLVGRPDGWECRVGHLRTVFKEGRDAIYTALKELVSVGLMGKETYLDGGMKRTRYTLNADQPTAPAAAQTRRSAPDPDSQDPGNPAPGIQDAGTSDPGKPTQVSTDLPNTDTESKEEQAGGSLRSLPGGDSTATSEASSTRTTGSPEVREDVERVCLHLADRIEKNGAKRPNIGVKWRDAARLMMTPEPRGDGRSEKQVHNMIEWCQSDGFWRSNILSMPTLREKYDQMRLVAMRGTQAAGASAAHQMPTDHPDVDKRRAALGG